ncbi:organic anion transporter 3 isoform X3 [Ursus arctos]|uniref:organic anion transporter 3 isoform X3 n=1 Tax=Ursus arctos TaxID=9644 RepID=UPI001CF83F7D|nr:organic anion transporter 3 isoform X3 [Ursus arctos]
MAFSELMDRVGSKGPFQFLNMVLLGLPVFGLANHYLLQIFTAATPAHHCRPPPNASTGPWVLPKGPNGKPEMCLRFIYPPNASLPNDTQGATEPCLDGWAYDLSTTDSIVTEWDLVCDSNRLKEVAQSVFMAGTLIGGIVLGDLSDRFGRKPILTCCYLLLAASGTGAAFSPSLSVYMVFRFLSGWSISGIVLSTSILNVECVSIQMRAIMSTVLGYCYTCGQFILPGLAYAIPQWRWLQLTVSIPFLAFFLLSWWIPESVRWMVVSGKFSKALKILRQMAALNGKKEEGEKLSVEVFHWFWLLQPGHECGRIWSEPLYPPAHLWWDRHPRQVHHHPLHKPSGPTHHPDLPTLRTVLAVFGKGCLSSSFSCLFLYATELYPTVIRQTGMGISNMWTRVGSMMAPLVKITGELQPFIPNAIFGTVTLLGGSAAYFLPETLNQPLPETIEDIETWSCWAKKPKQEPEAEKASLRIPLQPCGPGLDPS